MAPLWKVTYYGGMLFDWCRPIQRGWLSTGLRCIVVCFALGITLYQLFAAGFDLIQTVSKRGNVLHDCALGMAYFSTQPIISLIWLQFLLRRRQLLAFFHDWAKLEETTTAWSVDYVTIKRLVLRANMVYFFIVTFVCLCVIFQTFYANDSRDMGFNINSINYPELFKSPYFIPTCQVSFVMWSFHYSIFFALADLVPIFVYYYAAKHIEALDTEAQAMMASDSIISIQPIWFRFENLRGLVQRIDKLFGPMVICNHGMSFFTLCCFVYYSLNLIRNLEDTAKSGANSLPLQVVIVFLVVCIFRLVFSVRMISNVYKYSDKLLTTVNNLWVSRCNSATKEQSRVIKAFLARLHFVQLSACPGGLYALTPSVLLTFLSLIVSYTIILLQS